MNKNSEQSEFNFTPNSLDDHAVAGGFLGIQWSSIFARERPARLAKSLLTLKLQIDANAPNRRISHDGWLGDRAHRRRRSDHNPHIRDGEYGVVSAIDITDDPAHGCNADSIAESLRASRDSRVKYVIWNKKIFSYQIDPWEWREYSGSNSHEKHIHISVLPEKPLYDSETAWNITVS